MFNGVLKLAAQPQRRSKKRKRKTQSRTQSRLSKKRKPRAGRYDPLTQKPTKLGYYPQTRICYFGPPPDAGTTYGRYVCGTCKVGGKSFSLVSSVEKNITRHCAVCGKKLKLIGRITSEKWKPMLKAFRGHLAALPACAKCGTKHVSSSTTGRKRMAKHCVACGEKLRKAEAGSDYYEALSPIEAFDDVSLTEADINMVLFGEDTDDPFWNVDVQGRPVAQICLSDQPHPDEIRDVFLSAKYRESVAGAIEKTSLKDTLTQLRARPWANVVNEMAFAKKIKANSEGKVEDIAKGKFEDWKDHLLGCIGLVCSGMDKNFYEQIGNPLKEALYAEMEKWGRPEQEILEVIEAAFETGSTEYFETVLTKATEYMGLSKRALTEIEKAIRGANILSPTDEVVIGSNASTLATQMAAASVPVTETGSVRAHAAVEKTKEFKDRVRATMKRGRIQ